MRRWTVTEVTDWRGRRRWEAEADWRGTPWVGRDGFRRFRSLERAMAWVREREAPAERAESRRVVYRTRG